MSELFIMLNLTFTALLLAAVTLFAVATTKVCSQRSARRHLRNTIGK